MISSFFLSWNKFYQLQVGTGENIRSNVAMVKWVQTKGASQKSKILSKRYTSVKLSKPLQNELEFLQYCMVLAVGGSGSLDQSVMIELRKRT